MIALCFVDKGKLFPQVRELALCVLHFSRLGVETPAVGNVTEGHNTPKFYTERMKDDGMDEERRGLGKMRAGRRAHKKTGPVPSPLQIKMQMVHLHSSWRPRALGNS